MSLIVTICRAKIRMMGTLSVISLVLLAQLPQLDRARLASQAQSFAEQLPNLIGTEVLKQRSTTYSSRMRIRFGDSALKPIPPKIKEREIRSEIGFILRGKEDPKWTELRKVISVDGKSVTPPKKARERLAFGLKNDDDRARLKMMEEFTRYGLEGLATDYSLTLLLFRFGEIDRFQFQPQQGNEFAGADRVSVFAFSRPADHAALTVFDPKNASRQPLKGMIWLRQSDMLPIRIKLISELMQDKTQIVDEGTIEYGLSKFGTVTPQLVKYIRRVNGLTILETEYIYQNFQKFGADAELKFTP